MGATEVRQSEGFEAIEASGKFMRELSRLLHAPTERHRKNSSRGLRSADGLRGHILEPRQIHVLMRFANEPRLT
jgi:hypothetical protein